MNIAIKKSDADYVTISTEICEIKTVFNMIILKVKHDVMFGDDFVDALNAKFEFCYVHYAGSIVTIIPKHAGCYPVVHKYIDECIYEFKFVQEMITVE